jgi:hypothetical protein|eukprot:TRINITY_DN54971_c0_g1_i1.p1 TRINITY_DN54971_c0_g1~~TRINITY_DN54971_c0_g1_i1.p1  ORF type:complete len:354 (+),score=58.35 TRINITY_DN54971_c0_g1_i1:55-1062(+)
MLGFLCCSSREEPVQPAGGHAAATRDIEMMEEPTQDEPKENPEQPKVTALVQKFNKPETTQLSAAVKIQSQFRGNRGRQHAAHVKERQLKYQEQAVENAPAEELVEPSSEEKTSLMKVTIISARDLRDVGAKSIMGGSKSDPYVVVQSGHIEHTSKTVKSSLNPAFHEDFVVIYTAGQPITFTVYHAVKKGKPAVTLGQASLQPDEFKDGYNGELKLIDPVRKKGDGFLTVSMAFVDEDAGLTTITKWMVCARPIGLRTGPGPEKSRVGINLIPGEMFDVVEIVDGSDGQQFVRLADRRGWAFTRSPNDGAVLAERTDIDSEPEDDTDQGDATKK